MKKATAILYLLALLVFGSVANGQGSPGTFVFADVTVIDATGAGSKPNMSVVVVGDRIADIGPAGKIRTPRGAKVVNGTGKFLIPGLWDMHTHVYELGELGLALFVANGVTGIREMGGGDFKQLTSWRDKVEQGALTGPRMELSGPILESTRFVQLLERIDNASLVGKRIGVTTEAEADTAVDSLKALGVDFLKIRTSASPAAYRAIAAAAKRVGLTLVGHAPGGVSLVDVCDAGQRSIEHGLVLLNNYTDAEWKEIARRFVSNGTFSVPTLIAERGFRHMPDKDVLAIIDDRENRIDTRRRYMPAALLEYWRKSMDLKKFEGTPIDWGEVRKKNLHGFRLMHAAGVSMMAGTDVGAPLVFPGFGLHEELELLVREIGMTPLEALQCATRDPARFLGLGDSLGTVEKGKLADLVLLGADPLLSIGNTQKIAAVMVRGKLYPKAALKEMLVAVEGAPQK